MNISERIEQKQQEKRALDAMRQYCADQAELNNLLWSMVHVLRDAHETPKH